MESLFTYLEVMIIDDWVLRGIMVGHKKCRAADALGLVRQQVAALSVRIIGHHKACSQDCPSFASCLAAMPHKAAHQSVQVYWDWKRLSCCVLQLCSSVACPSPLKQWTGNSSRAKLTYCCSASGSLLRGSTESSDAARAAGCSLAANSSAAVLALLCALLSVLHLLLSVPVILFACAYPGASGCPHAAFPSSGQSCSLEQRTCPAPACRWAPSICHRP